MLLACGAVSAPPPLGGRVPTDWVASRWMTKRAGVPRESHGRPSDPAAGGGAGGGGRGVLLENCRPKRHLFHPGDGGSDAEAAGPAPSEAEGESVPASLLGRETATVLPTRRSP